MIAVVALPIPRALPFDYLVPPGMKLEVGDRVLVPFRRRNLWGVVVEIRKEPTYPGKLQTIAAQAGMVLPPAELAIVRAISEDSYVSIGLALRRIVPPQVRPRARRLSLAIPKDRAAVKLAELAQRAPAQARALAAASLGPRPEAELCSIARVSSTTISALIKKGFLRPEVLPFAFPFCESTKRVKLTQAQIRAVDAIAKALGTEQKFLLFGPAGSGKTEVYLQAAKEALGQGLGALLLEPEISLLPQLWARAEHALGRAPALYFGELPPGERWRVWEAALSGTIRAAVGTRSAVFLPIKQLGLIVLDEEGEPAYKQEEMAPHYHAREVAELRSKAEGAVVVLGGASPQVETFFRAERGEIKLIELPDRVAGAPPQVELVPHHGQVITETLQEAIERHLSRRGEVLLFVNRIGFFTGAACQSCGAILRCPTCELPLVFHLADKSFRCHACGRASFPRCSQCGGKRLRLFGVGTERVEHEAKLLFPRAKVARLDSETAPRRTEILAALSWGEIDILVGTQMVGKGLDFPRITLVGVINADQLLAIPDFRAGERTFQLVAAASGRAGRGEIPGEVIIQTDNPDHYAVALASRGDFRALYSEEIRFREALRYPPFSRLVRIMTQGKKAEAQSGKLAERLSRAGFEVLGPARLLPLRGIPRYQLLVRGADDLIVRLRGVLPELPPGAQLDPNPIWIG